MNKKKDLENSVPSIPPSDVIPKDDVEAKAPSIVSADPVKRLANQYLFIKLSGTGKSYATAERLADEPKVDIVVFPLPDEADIKVHYGGINGVFYGIVVGVSVSVPKSIAEKVNKDRISNISAERNIIVTNPFTGEKVNVNLDAAPDETKRRLGIL